MRAHQTKIGFPGSRESGTFERRSPQHRLLSTHNRYPSLRNQALPLKASHQQAPSILRALENVACDKRSLKLQFSLGPESASSFRMDIARSTSSSIKVSTSSNESNDTKSTFASTLLLLFLLLLLLRLSLLLLLMALALGVSPTLLRLVIGSQFGFRHVQYFKEASNKTRIKHTSG